jgi:hypothetical protein
MNTIRPIARAILPYQFRVSVVNIRNELETLYRPVAFWQAFAEFRRLRCFEDVDQRLLERLTFGWGNRYSAHTEYMAAYLRYASRSKGPVLECGSGLSTLLLGVVAAHHGNQVLSLEHDLTWGDRVQKLLQRWQIKSVELNIDKLQRYWGFDWYRIPDVQLPQKFSLVVCDGPPGETFGGRYGLIPMMAKYLGPNTTILLDDYERTGEQTIVENWQKQIPCHVEAHGDKRKYSVITIRE